MMLGEEIGSVTYVKNILFIHGICHVWGSQELADVNYFLNIFEQRITDYFKQNWHEALNESSRCFHYKHYKSLLNPLPHMPILVSSNSAANKDMMAKIWTNRDTIIYLIIKHCGKRRNCSLRAISPFPTMFFKSSLLLVC